MRAAERCNRDKRSVRRDSAGGAVVNAASAAAEAARCGVRAARSAAWPSGEACEARSARAHSGGPPVLMTAHR